MPSVLALLENDISANPPDGFRLVPTGGGFNVLFGPVYACLEEGRMLMGFRVSHRHVNPHETCHGGVLASFADFQGYAAQQESGHRHVVTPTIAMTIDYLAPALLGDWLEARTELLRATRTMLFTQTLASVDDKVVFRSSSIFKIGRPAQNPASTIGDFFTTAERPSP